MSPPGKNPRQKVTAKPGLTPSTAAMLEVRVTLLGGRRRSTRHLSEPARLGGAKVELFPQDPRTNSTVGSLLAGTTGTDQNNEGLWRTETPIRSGWYWIRVSSPGCGVPPPIGAADQRVRVGSWLQRVQLISVMNSPPNPNNPQSSLPNRVDVVLAWRHPIVRVRVFDTSSGRTPMSGAHVEIIGVTLLDSAPEVAESEPIALDDNGEARVAVLVRRTGFVSSQLGSPDYYREVTLRDSGRLKNEVDGADINLSVELSRTPPSFIPGTATQTVSLWVSGGATPHSVARDPRFPPTPFTGQAGWDEGIPTYTIGEGSFHHLALLLSGQFVHEPHVTGIGGTPIRPHQLRRLALVAHGDPGVVDVDQREAMRGFGAARPAPERSLTVARLPIYRADLLLIRQALAQNAVVILGSCTAAGGDSGEALLCELSRLWPTVSVVGIRGLAAVPTNGNQRHPSGAQWAGLRDTGVGMSPGSAGAATNACNSATEWQDLTVLPWISETSRCATVARDGNIIRRGDPPWR